MTVRHGDLYQGGFVHDIGLFDDVVFVQDEGGQGVDIVRSKVPRQGPDRHGALDVVENRRRVGHSAPWRKDRVGCVERAYASHQTRVRNCLLYTSPSPRD